jgi:hypothetical protein
MGKRRMKKKYKICLLVASGVIIVLLFLVGISGLFVNNTEQYQLDKDYQSKEAQGTDESLDKEWAQTSPATMVEAVTMDQNLVEDGLITEVTMEDEVFVNEDEIEGIDYFEDEAVASDSVNSEGTHELSQSNLTSEKSALAEQTDEDDGHDTGDTSALDDESDTSGTGDTGDTSDTSGTSNTGDGSDISGTGDTSEASGTGDESGMSEAGDTDDGSDTTYTGDAYLDATIEEHRDEISDDDLNDGLSIGDKIDRSIVVGYLEDGLTEEEKVALKAYLHSVLTDAEYETMVELFYRYNYILE